MEIQIFHGFGEVLKEVSLAFIPLGLFFLFFQVFMLKLTQKKLIDLCIGLILTFVGLALFLQGVHVGFLPVGNEIGEIAGGWSYKWILIPIGFLLGFVATFAEPAVAVLNKKVEDETSGYIPKKLLLYTLSTGVAISIALAMTRILFGLSLWYFIAPGYILVALMMIFADETFTAIAFDAGSVATGPMTVTFILAIGLGVADTIEGSDPLIEGFGMIALVALAPIITILGLGLLYRINELRSDD
ncbi:MAG: DUF1538 domain-containing protein [Balneolaceae bacterium]